MGQNTVELLGYYGDDLTIACSAWTSTSRNLSEDKLDRVQSLIEMLWINGHETPFEKSTVHFLINTEIATHIQLIKHRIGVSVNAESARYKELKEDKYYLPEDWADIGNSCDAGNGLRGFCKYEQPWVYWLEEYTKLGNELYHRCIEDLEPVLGRKRAKESARFFKTYNSQIQADVMFNMRSFANFIQLRNSKHAQKEIREIAQDMWDLVSTIEGEPFKYTLNAIWNGRS
jgi:thymidylate synthase (FAD)